MERKIGHSAFSPDGKDVVAFLNSKTDIGGYRIIDMCEEHNV